MSAQPQSAPATEADLERTAELPMLDVAAYEAAESAGDISHTDTWVAPVPVVTPTGLEADLRAVSTSLRELEGRLVRKTERLEVLESEIEGLQSDREAALARAASEKQARESAASALADALARAARAEQRIEQQALAARALEERGSQLAGEAERLRNELRLAQEIVADKAQQLGLRAADVAAREERIARLEAEARESAIARDTLKSGLDSATARAAALEAELQAVRSEYGAAGRALNDRGATIAELQNTIAERDRDLAARRAELGTVQERLQGHLESLSTLHGQRGVYEQLYAQLDAAVADRDSEVVTQLARAERLAGELDALRRELAERVAAERALRAQLEARTTEGASVADRIKSLEGQLLEQEELLRAVREELGKSQGRSAELEEDLRAAEDTIHRQESDLRTGTQKLEDLAKEQQGLHALLGEARAAIEQREGRIRTLESEAARSHAALDHIQVSMQRLDPLATTGTEAALEGAARLLIRKDGDVEVVHVLGRRTTVGRTPENDLQLDTKFISRHHAVILCGPVYTIIEDLNSTNGVMVNNHRVSRHTLKDGDAVVIGKTQFRFVVRQGPTRN